ncbi:MAG: hypothetical protein KC731_01165, partial [Myxococcales bacterium]|nr:hypothetical protein [Myxococcales bacterium]
MIETWALSRDLASGWVVVAAVLAGLSVVLLAIELKRQGGRAAVAVAGSGVLAVAAMFVAVVRPVRIEERGASVGARLLVLLDASRSIDLPADGARLRRDVMGELLPKIAEHFSGIRTRVALFGQEPEPYTGSLEDPHFTAPPVVSSDLSAALEALSRTTDELPQAVIVVSDGRLDRPGSERVGESVKAALGSLDVAVHTVALTRKAPADAAVRAVRMAGAVVAHQPVSITVEVACSGGLECDEIPVVARELHQSAPPVERASGVAKLRGDTASVELELTLDRAGKRIVEIAIDSPDGDEVPENDRRLLTVDVARDRIRLLHVAGRPTYDVRALRTWLKSDACVDVVAFFILRTHDDNVVAPQDELALIPFPVDELFTVHLPSFDAVILQDFDARPYGLSKHLPSLTRYVKQGGGLIMVGGPNAFVMGSYAQTPLAEVLPVSLDGIPRGDAVDLARFVPKVTAAGRHAPVLEPLTALMGLALPEMPGTNVVGDPRDGATVLLAHPERHTASGADMPVLALGEYGSGRTIALTVDGSHKLLFSTFAVDAAGRAHGAFWDALLGWLMRDPRFEPARVALPRGCIAGTPATLEVRAVFVDEGAPAEVVVTRMGTGEEVLRRDVTVSPGGEPVRVPIGSLAAGGYTATVQLQRQGRSAPSRYDFACEA